MNSIWIISVNNTATQYILCSTCVEHYLSGSYIRHARKAEERFLKLAETRRQNSVTGLIHVARQKTKHPANIGLGTVPSNKNANKILLQTAEDE